MLIKSSGYIEKASKLAEGEVEFVVSTNDWDSHGERINVEGIDLKEFKRNPVVLWGHDGFNLPIARATKIWKESNKLMARAKFYLKDDFARKIYEYIIDGYLQAVSIGGLVQEWGEDGLTIAKLLMKEFSVVSVPANPSALVANKILDGNQKAELRSLANIYARKILTNSDGNKELKDHISTLKSLVATLEEVVKNEPEEVKANDKVLVVLRQSQAVDKQIERIIKVVKKERINL